VAGIEKEQLKIKIKVFGQKLLSHSIDKKLSDSQILSWQSLKKFQKVELFRTLLNI